MKTQDEANKVRSDQVMIVAGTIIVAAIALLGIWIVGSSGPGSSPTPEPTESAQSTTVWPTPKPTFTPTSTSTPAIPTGTPTSTPTPTLTPSPSPTPSPTPRVFKIQELGQLTSVEFTAVTVVELERKRAISNPLGFGPEGIPLGADRILMEAVGIIKFGIDLKQVKQSDVTVSGNEVRIILPRAQVTGVELLPGQTKIYDSEESWLLSEFEGMETEALDKGKSQLENWAKGEGNLINIAEKLAALQLQNFLYTIGFEKTDISFKEQGR